MHKLSVHKEQNSVNSKKIIVAVFEELKYGGAKNVSDILSQCLLKKTDIEIINLNNKLIKSFSNIFSYLFNAILIKPIEHKKIAKYINKKADILLVHHSWITKSPHVIRYVKKPIIYICHEAPREYYDNEHIKNQNIKERVINIIRLPIKWIDKKNINKNKNRITFIANSNLSKKIIDRTYSVNSLVFYPGIRAKKVKYADYKENKVLTVGAINKLKNQLFFVDILKEIDESIRPELIIVGNQVDKKYAKLILERSVLNKVKTTILLNITDNELQEIYSNSKLFLYAPINEPFGMVVEEAMMNKLALVVKKNGGGYSEIISKKNGYIINTVDTVEWAKSISDLLNDEGKREDIGIYNHQYVTSRYDSRKYCENIYDLIISLVNKKFVDTNDRH